MAHSHELRSSPRGRLIPSVFSALMALFLAACGTGLKDTPTQTTPGTPTSATTAAPATEVVDINILSKGVLDPRYTVINDVTTPLNCTYLDASPVARTTGVVRCGSVADSAFACWRHPTKTNSTLCLGDPWGAKVTERTTTGLPAVLPPPTTDVMPFGVELADGSRWWKRMGGAWDPTPEGTFAAYGCVVDSGCSMHEALAGDDQGFLKGKDGNQQVLRVTMGSDAAALPAPHLTQVRKLYFAKADSPAGPREQAQDPCSNDVLISPNSLPDGLAAQSPQIVDCDGLWAVVSGPSSTVVLQWDAQRWLAVSLSGSTCRGDYLRKGMPTAMADRVPWTC